jgi:Domain of unknown function (DUF4115)
VPSTRVERILALAGLALAAALAGLAVPAWLDYRSSEPARAEPAVPVRATVAEAPTVSAATTEAAETRSTTTTGAVATADVRLVAARGDCWLDVRRSAGGPSLFAGILPQGESRRFEGRSLRIEIGAPGALDVTLNGEPVGDLPQSPATVVATADGIELVPA